MKQLRKSEQNPTNDPVTKTDLEYYAGLMASIRDAVISTDEKFVIKSWNKGAEKIYGYTARQAIGKVVNKLLATDYNTVPIEKLIENFKHDGHFRAEVIQTTKSGNKIHVLASSSALYDKAHKFTGAVIVYKDITERKKLEEQLKGLNEGLEEQVLHKTKELTDIFERITDGFIALDTNWCYTYANKKIGEMTQLDPASMIGKNVWKVFPDAVGSATYEIFHKAMEEQKPMSNVDYFERLDLWQENLVYPSPHGISVFIKDISNQKRAEQKILQANRLYFFISQINQMIVRVTEEHMLFKDACNIAVDVGKFRMAWIGRLDEASQKIIPVMHAGEDQEYLPMIKHISLTDDENPCGPAGIALRAGNYFICNDIKTEAVLAPWSITAMNDGYQSTMLLPLKKFGKVVGAITFYAPVKNFFDQQEIALLEEATGDVSFALENFEKEIIRKKAEEEIASAYKENEITLNRINDSVVSVDNNWRYTFLNDAALATHPLGKEETLGKVIWDVHPEMRGTIFWHKYHEAMEKKIIIEMENYYEAMDTWFYVKIYPSPEGLTLFYKDITESKKVEQAVRNSEEKRRLIMNAAMDAIICMDIKGLITFWNPQAEKIFGWKEQEVVGCLLSETIIPVPFRKMHEKGLRKYLTTGEGPVLNALLELKAINRAGKEFPVELTILPIKQGDEEFFCAFIRDITQHRQEEMRIAKAAIDAQEDERHHIGLELHDNVNQILVGSLLNLGMVKPVPDEKAREFVEVSKNHILSAIEEIRKLSHQLAPASFDDVSLNQAFESLLLSINTNDQFKIDLSFQDLKKGLVSHAIQINLYRILQEQVSNIVKYSAAVKIEVSVAIHGRFISMRIFDNGIGFDIKNTKKGIGLGNIKKRAELFSGAFALNSAPNKGCELLVEIPLDN